MRLSLDHRSVEIESFQNTAKAGVKAKVQLRPLPGQRFASNLLLEGNKSLIDDYPVGTRFKVQAALTTRASGDVYLHTSWQWDARVLWRPDQTV